MDRDGIPLAFSIFPGNENEQPSLKPLETKGIQQMGCNKFIYCSDAGLASQANRRFNHTADRSFVVTQSIKKFLISVMISTNYSLLRIRLNLQNTRKEYVMRRLGVQKL